ncbi:LacI family DNA-binding transcriptional regulator [Christensenella tenuis]|uniref:LacI family DNA-binding transcriptional regulator n=1 Tax=Christensenella tenuis TaxID=2763033 RepID=A0ABR7EF39_9FIRM|nr:LacI family DNA-binding transcriptional regulator [Christensenella tenuis]MBC5647734.1 LacI family DNA-binding transcriptional regulator [Christensenella tenuis]
MVRVTSIGFPNGRIETTKANNEMITLKDVAKRAGVSPSTVSYVLSGKKKVKEETRSKIYEAVKTLNYSPNKVARSLKTNSTNTIGVMVNNLSDMFFIDILKAIESTAYEYKYNVILCDAVNSEEREISNLRSLLGQRIDGLIFAGTGKNKKLNLDRLGIPVVTLDRSAGSGSGSIYVDNVKGGELATEHLIQAGKLPIALITYSTLISTFFDRMYGYRKTLEKYGLPYNEDLVVVTDFGTYNEGYNAVRELLKRKVEFQSLFAVNDMLALGAMRALVEEHYKIPEDISVVGYDDIPIAKLFLPALTTVSQPQYQIGRKATELLIRTINKEPIEEAEKSIVITPELIVRETA